MSSNKVKVAVRVRPFNKRGEFSFGKVFLEQRRKIVCKHVGVERVERGKTWEIKVFLLFSVTLWRSSLSLSIKWKKQLDTLSV